jgi:hypothetical protein
MLEEIQHSVQLIPDEAEHSYSLFAVFIQVMLGDLPMTIPQANGAAMT